MNKHDFVKAVAGQVDGLSQEQVNKVIDAVASTIVEQVRDNNETIAIPGLGTFKCKASAARTGRNPLNGETINIAASRTIAFKAMPSVKVAE